MNACVIEATARHQKHLQVRHAYDAIPEATQLNKRTKGFALASFEVLSMAQSHGYIMLSKQESTRLLCLLV